MFCLRSSIVFSQYICSQIIEYTDYVINNRTFSRTIFSNYSTKVYFNSTPFVFSILYSS